MNQLTPVLSVLSIKTLVVASVPVPAQPSVTVNSEIKKDAPKDSSVSATIIDKDSSVQNKDLGLEEDVVVRRKPPPGWKLGDPMDDKSKSSSAASSSKGVT